MYEKISIHIATKDRATEVGLLLQSLRTQTYQNFNIIILDDASKVPLFNFYFINYLVNRLKLEGHKVTLLRNNVSAGVSGARQQLVEYNMKESKETLFARIDDDVILEQDFLERMIKVLEKGYDLASGVTTPFNSPDFERETRFIEPIVNECFLDETGKLKLNMDDCGCCYLNVSKEQIYPAHHFRSCAVYKRSIHEAGIDYKSRLSKHGFREEQIFSFKILAQGFKIGVDLQANARHLMTPSGGERSTTNLSQFNQMIFEETTKKLFEKYGNFIQKYNEMIGIGRRELDLEKYENQLNLASK